MQNTILKFFYGALVIATVSTTGAAATKISAGHKTVKAETGISAENQIVSTASEEAKTVTKSEHTSSPSQKMIMDNSQEKTGLEDDSKQSKSPKTIPQSQADASVTATNQNSNATTDTFTLADLATHNTSNSCYIAHNGAVYNVTNTSSCAGCRHHGANGGIDITSSFPHPISYLNNLNKVGILASVSATTSTSTIQSSGQINQSSQNNSKTEDHEDDEDEFEHEDDD